MVLAKPISMGGPCKYFLFFLNFKRIKRIHTVLSFTLASYGQGFILRAMKDFFRNPHTFDMNNYYSGHTVEVGGRDFEKEEKETITVKQPQPTKEVSFEMD